MLIEKSSYSKLLINLKESHKYHLMFFDKYKNKRGLGKGAFGQVYLVEDQQGKEYAMKLISKAAIQKEPYLVEYLDGEIECMKTMDCPYIIKLYETLSDNDYIYLLLEFCDGGDLVGYQGDLKEKVYSLDKATFFLADVIKGLEYLHAKGYLHRDLKLQNVLRSTIGGKEVCKLADFGFSKPMKDTGGTNLGTEQFKAP